MLILGNKEVETDSHGYLKNMSDWTPELAVIIAAGEQITLSDAH